MILRPTVFIFLAWILSAISCSRRQYPVQTTQTTSVTTITEVQHDTIVTVQPDTSMLQALIECDSTGQAYLREINQLKSSSYLHQSLNLTNNILTATAAVDSMDIYLTYKDRYQTTTNTNSGDYCYVSASWEQNAGPLTPDNWLITPEIVIPEGGATITWYTAAQDANYPNEYYNVLVSYNASTDVNDFSTVLHTETISNDVWKWHSANIEGGHTVRIAFRHFNVSDMFQMKLDDVKIVAGLNGINEAEGANALVFVQDRSIEVRNAGNQPVFIYDATGRCLVNGTTDNESFAMPAAGVYMVKIGLNPAQKVVIAK